MKRIPQRCLLLLVLIALFCTLVTISGSSASFFTADAGTDTVQLSFDSQNLETEAVLYAAIYNSSGKMLEIQTAHIQDGTVASSFTRSAHDAMAYAKLFFLENGTFRPLDGAQIHRPAIGVDYSFYPSTQKVMMNEALAQMDSFTIRLAKNEAEGCQIVFAPDAEGTSGSCTLEYTNFVNDAGHTLRTEIFEERYIVCESNDNYGVYPDALVPVASGHSFSFDTQQNHPFYIKVWAGKEAPAGLYTASLTLTAPLGDTLTLDLTAEVWDFALPDTPACTTAFGLNREYVAEHHGLEPWSEENQALYEAYYEFLLDHNISAYELPVDILSEEAAAYMSDPRMTSFSVPYFEEWLYGEEADELTLAYYERVFANPDWAAKSYYYVVDEPFTAEQYGWYLEAVERLSRLCPGYHMVMPTHIIEFEEDGEYYNSVLMHALGADIFCPLSTLLEDEAYVADIEEYLPDATRWWYICCGPAGEYCNVLTNFEGIRARLLLWQQMDMDVTGLLYWSTTFWEEGSPWDNGWTYRGSEEPDWSFEEFGDGSLLYPGSKVGIDGPVASLRLEILSDGIDDFDYLTLAQERFGQDYVDRKLAKVTTSLTEYTRDDALLQAVRTEIGRDLSRSD